MVRKHFAVLGLVLSLLFIAAGSARANLLSSATATADCSGFILTVTAVDLNIGNMYTIDFTFTLTPTSGPAITVPGSITFTATSTTATETDTGSWPGAPLSANVTVTGSATLTSSGSTLPITVNGSTSVVLSCASTGCPATIGFWKNEKKHPFPDSVQLSGLTIGGVTYSKADLYTILKAHGGNAVVILGRQLVGALLNLAAGGQHNATADAAISDAETLLQNNSLNLLTSFVNPSSTLGGELLADEVILDGYNSSNFNTCSEGSGLTLGS